MCYCSLQTACTPSLPSVLAPVFLSFNPSSNSFQPTNPFSISPLCFSVSPSLCLHLLTEKGQLVAASSPGCTSISALQHQLPNLNLIVCVLIHLAPSERNSSLPSVLDSSLFWSECVPTKVSICICTSLILHKLYSLNSHFDLLALIGFVLNYWSNEIIYNIENYVLLQCYSGFDNETTTCKAIIFEKAT